MTNSNTGPLQSQLLSQVLGLSVACPFSQGNPCDCPLHEIRKSPFKTRMEWVKQLSEAEALHILEFHRGCLEQKEQRESDAK